LILGTFGIKTEDRENPRLPDSAEDKTTMNTYHIVLADDHPLVREGLRRILEDRADLRVVAEAGDGVEVLDLLDKLAFDMAILDLSMPNIGGIETTHRIKKARPDIKVLILTIHRTQEYLQQAILAGADGYLLKEEEGADLFSAIEKIRKGGTYISPQLCGK
jgi:DNA-binding NarL/FixJ family response regulator